MEHVPCYKLIMYKACLLWQIHLHCQFFVRNIQCPLIPPGMDHMKQECTYVNNRHSIWGEESSFFFVLNTTALFEDYGCLSGFVQEGEPRSLIKQFICKLILFLFHNKSCVMDWSPCRSSANILLSFLKPWDFIWIRAALLEQEISTAYFKLALSYLH